MFSQDPPRLELIGVPGMDDAQRRVHDAIADGPRRRRPQGTLPIMDDAGRLLGPFAVMLLAPPVGGALQQVGSALRFGNDLGAPLLTDRQRELADLAVASAHRCDFEWRAHEVAARKLDLAPGQLADIADGRVPEGLTDSEAMVCRMAAIMARDRSLADDEYEAAIGLLGAPTLAELTWLVGYYSALALALAVFRPAGPAGSAGS